jgi:hypothetical protein
VEVVFFWFGSGAGSFHEMAVESIDGKHGEKNAEIEMKGSRADGGCSQGEKFDL